MMARWLALASALILAACVAQPDRPSPSGSPSAVPRGPAAAATAVADDALARSVEDALRRQDQRLFRAVAVEAFAGRILLMGAVEKPGLRRRAEQLAAAQTGVARVHNELVLAEDKALALFAADPARQAMVAGLLAAQPVGRETAWRVRVVGGVAFLLGRAAPADAIALKAAATEADGIKWVVALLEG